MELTNAIFAEESSVVTLVANENDCFVDLDVPSVQGGIMQVARVQELVVDTSRPREFVSPSTVRPCM